MSDVQPTAAPTELRPDEREAGEPIALPPAEAPTRSERVPILTLALCVACVVVYAGISLRAGPPTWEDLSRWGYLSPQAIRDGAWWALLTSAVVHLELWHLAFNVYWLWILGRLVERHLGTARYAALVLASAFVSSSAQLAVSDTTGIGASGFVYALFGSLWARRDMVPAFRTLAKRTAQLFFAWLVLCIVVSQIGIAQIGNAAHVAGLTFGLLAGYGWGLESTRRRLAAAATLGLVALAVVPLLWAPWSPSWIMHRAYAAHGAERYDDAIVDYRRLLAKDGRNVWARENLALAYASKGDVAGYAATLAELRALDPKAAAEVEATVRAEIEPKSSSQRR